MYKLQIERFLCCGIVAVFSFLSISCSTDKDEYIPVMPKSAWLSGGQQTVFIQGSGAFSAIFPVLSGQMEMVHEIGDVQFEQAFVTAPAPINPGLGPIYNNVSCTACHVGDGRGTVPSNPEDVSSLLFRTSLPGENKHGGPIPVPGFGLQLQNQGVLETQREVLINISYQQKTDYFADGTAYTLRVPTYSVTESYTNFPSNAMLSPRVAPPVFGLGLLEAIAKEDILASADPNDTNKDGVSGKANYVWNIKKQKMTLGRFGWKANVPTILQQVAAAYHGDMGITSSLFPKESSYSQPQYDALKDDHELSDSLLHSVAFYIRTLAVPARRNVTATEVQYGKEIFTAVGCAKCHTPTMRTAVDVSFPAISNQVIHPYTDLLLHDMGEGLADHRPDFKANGREWRTPPLWGIGLTQTVNGHHTFLHDGRARSLMEAILWHGGEAAASRNKVKALSKSDRKALIAFMKSL